MSLLLGVLETTRVKKKIGGHIQPSRLDPELPSRPTKLKLFFLKYFLKKRAILLL